MTSNDFKISKGLGNIDERCACVMALAAMDWQNQNGKAFRLTDIFPSACPVIRTLLIAANDGIASDRTRERLLRPWVKKVINSKVDHRDTQRRYEICFHFGLDTIDLRLVGCLNNLTEINRIVRRLPADKYTLARKLLPVIENPHQQNVRRAIHYVAFRLGLSPEDLLALAERCLESPQKQKEGWD